jgi:type I restriction enzyme S subunit
MTRYKPYSTYKPSGVEWLGDVPKHWQLQRLKFVCHTNPAKSEVAYLPNDTEVSFCPMESVGNGTISTESKKLLGEVRQGFTYFRDGDIVIAKITPSFENGKGAIASNLVNGLGFGTTELHVLRPSSLIDRNFLYYLTVSGVFRGFGATQMYGTAGQKRISDRFLNDFPTPLPPLQDQRLIAHFLDRETARLETLITKKCELIDLLQKKRSAIITNAVTRGLDPQVPMKDSRLEWVDKIPAHWEVKRLKFTADIQTGLTLGKDYKGRNIVNRPYLRVANVQDGFLDLETITEISIPVEDSPRYELKFGDVLMTEGGDFDKLGRGYVWEEQIEGCLHQNHVFAVRPNLEHLDSHYLAALMTSHYGKAYFTSTSQQTTNLATTNRTKLSNFPMPLPDVAEQKNIIDYISKKNQQLLLIIEKLTQQIDTLQKYRSALVSAAITGKIDMSEEANRGVA